MFTLRAHTHHAEVEVGLDLLRGTVLEGEGGARVNVTVLQGSLGNDSLSFIVSTVNGSAQGTATKHCDSECEQFTMRSNFYLHTKISMRFDREMIAGPSCTVSSKVGDFFQLGRVCPQIWPFLCSVLQILHLAR